MLNHGAPANCIDSKGLTPIHLAAKIGASIDIAELKEKGHANVNAQDKSGKTPLFYAKDYKTVIQLLKYGADPRTKAYDGKEVSALEFLIKHNQSNDCSEAILDACLALEKNSDLIMDFGIFKDGFDDSERTNMDQSIIETCVEVMDSDANYKIIIHPLLQTFLRLKVQTVWPLFTLFTVFYHLVIVPVTMTSAGVVYSMHTSCTHTSNNSNGIPCFKTNFKDWTTNFCHNAIVDPKFSLDEDSTRFEFICTHGDINFTSIDLTTGRTSYIQKWDQSFLYYWTIAVLAIYTLQELLELLVLKRQYFTFIENLYSWMFIGIASGFIVTSNLFPYYANDIVGWLVFVVWFEVFLYIGNCNMYYNLGDYAYMSVQVAKPALLCLIAHIPIFLAFTFGFDIMMRNNPVFDMGHHGFLGTFGKVMSMMFEPTYEANFSYDYLKKYGGHLKSSQAMFLMFIVMIPLIVMNMLIAVSVSETDLKGMMERSRLMRTKRKIRDLKNFTYWSQWYCCRTLLKPLEYRVSFILQ